MSETKHTPGPWREGKWGASVVADEPIQGGLQGSDAVEHYGGHLIAESVAPCNRPVITAAPDMLGMLKDIGAWLKLHLDTNIVHRQTGKGGHDGDGSSWAAAAIPDWDVRQRLDQITALTAEAEGRNA